MFSNEGEVQSLQARNFNYRLAKGDSVAGPKLCDNRAVIRPIIFKGTERRRQAMTDEAMSDDQMRERLIQLAFGGQPQRFQEFCNVLRQELPKNSGAVLRGSAVTGVRWNDGAPFDTEGPGTSDLDLLLIGDEVIGLYTSDGFYIPLIHSKPLCDKDPEIAPGLIPLREKLQAMVNRPVNIQATRDFVRFVREELLGEPHLHLFEITD